MKTEEKKPGRNEKCYCGSGKKYKKCCLQTETESSQPLIIPPSIYQIITAKYFIENHFSLLDELRKLEIQLFNTLTDFNKAPVDILKDYINNCELLMKGIASNHSTYEMLFWSRRLAPLNIFDVSDLSVMLYREIQSLCIYKFGTSDDNIVIDDNFSVFPRSIEQYNKMEYSQFLEKIQSENLPKNISDIISDTIRVEILSFLYLKGTQFYRIANKGGEVLIDTSNKKISTNTTEDLDFLIDLYDERLSKSNIFSMTGAYVNHEIDINDSCFCPFFQLNVDHKITTDFFNAKNEAYSKVFLNEDVTIEIKTNFLLGALNLKSIYDFLKLFEDEFEQYYSFSVKDFILFLGYLGNKVVSDISFSIDSQFQILNRAYIIAHYDLKTFGEEFEKVYPSLSEIIFKEKINYKIDVVKILNTFLLKSDNKIDIDLWTRGPKRFLYQLSENFMLIDYTSLTDIISYLVKEITSVGGEIGNRRAIYFEEALKTEIKTKYGAENMWISRGEITSGKLKKEIDASFIIDDILFVFEAKAVNVSFGYDKGDKKALDYRIEKMKEALQESNEKAEFIQKNRKTLNQKLPENIRFICPLVISSNPEYIWSTGDELFLSKELKLPRILTIHDIKDLQNINLNILKEKNWIISL